jgi:hypothetical protein
MPFQVNNFKVFLTGQPENLISENLYVIEKTNVPMNINSLI